jgi:hypothetical protein
MPTQITSSGITFNDTTSLTSANGVPSAIKLTTARTINGVAFDGTANITVPATASGANVAKAWVNFDGTLATPISTGRSYNVSSVTKNGVGDYTVSFATPMTDVNYAVSFGCGLTQNASNNSLAAGCIREGNPLSTGSFRMTNLFGNSANVDGGTITATVFGN